MNTEYIFKYNDAQGIEYQYLRLVSVSNREYVGIFEVRDRNMEVELFLNRVSLNEEGKKLVKEDIERIFDAVKPVNCWRDVINFHKKFELDYVGPPRKLTEDLETFRRNFIKEEYEELMDVNATDADRLDACCDLIYVILGYCRLRGWNFPKAWGRVQEANMNKRRANNSDESRHSLDVVKPEGWQPPDHTDLV